MCKTAHIGLYGLGFCGFELFTGITVLLLIRCYYSK